MPLSAKHKRFVAEYLVDLNGPAAYIRAGYSERGAKQSAHRLMQDPAIQAAIEAGAAKAVEKVEVTVDRVVAELAKIGFGKLSDVTDWGVKEVAIGYDADGKKLPPEDIGDAALVRYVDAPFITPTNRDDLPEDIRAIVSEVSLGKDGFKIKLHDKSAALTQLGRYLGMFVDKVEHGVTGDLADRLAAARKRATAG